MKPECLQKFSMLANSIFGLLVIWLQKWTNTKSEMGEDLSKSASNIIF